MTDKPEPESYHLTVRAVSTERRSADGSVGSRTKFVASTADVDRMGDIIDQNSWILDAFKANPVILWAHDSSEPPIGRAVSVEVVGGALQIEVEWDEDDPQGIRVARQFARGFLHAGSVGFRPGKATPRRQLPKDDPRRTEDGWGMLFEANELLEFSAVPVPANAHALAQRSAPVMEAASFREALADALRSDPEVRKMVAAVALGTAAGAPLQASDTNADLWADDEPDESGWTL
jgi:HK97 family phage prohead protease